MSGGQSPETPGLTPTKTAFPLPKKPSDALEGYVNLTCFFKLYVTTRIILFSNKSKSVPLCDVHTNLPPVLVALFLGAVVTLHGQSESRLALEQKASRPPFQSGDQLDIQSDAAAFSATTRVTILSTMHWPWVRVRSEQGEAWLNFDHVVVAKNVVSTR